MWRAAPWPVNCPPEAAQELTARSSVRGIVSAALLLIDFVNPFDFDGAADLLPHAAAAARAVTAFKRRTEAAGIPSIYVNDNYDRWHGGFHELVSQFREERVPGVKILDLLEIDEARDHFIVKPKHSGFYCTALDVLLGHLGARTLILSGLAGNICVFFTANDAHMRGYDLIVPSDCIASESPADNDYALRQMKRVLGARVAPSSDIDLSNLKT